MKPKRALPVLGRLSEETIAEAVRATLGEMRSEGAPATALADAVFPLFEEALAQVEARVPASRAKACSEGCAYCCHLKVLITPLEAVRLGTHLRSHLEDAALAKVRARVVETNARTRGMEMAQRSVARIPCPLLDEGGRCVAYEGRPTACAGANSFDADQCRRGFESEVEDVSIDHYGLQRRTADAARAGATGATFEAGLDGRLLELVAALEVLLRDETACERWTSGARPNPFESAVDEEFAKLLDATRGRS